MRDVINIEKEPYNFAVSIESVSLFDFELNLFSPNVPFMDKPGSLFLLAKCLKNTCGRVTFLVKMQVDDLHLYVKCHSSTGVFETFCW